MTSTDGAASCGWINRSLISSKKLVPHMNPFDLANWQTPAPLDTYPAPALDAVAKSVLGVTLDQIRAALPAAK